MKRITIIVCGFSLAIALVALPFQYMEHITSGLGLSLAAVLLAWIGILQRKSSQETYKHDVRLYSASTLMKVVDVEESEFESGKISLMEVHGCAAKRYIFRLTNMR